MTLFRYEDGKVINDNKSRSNFGALFRAVGFNNIRQLIDRNPPLAKGQTDAFSEAYIDANGRRNSVDTDRANTTAFFDTDKYKPGISDEASGDTTADPDSFTNPGNAFDNDDSTFAQKTTGTTSSFDVSLGKTFSSKYVAAAFIKAEFAIVSGVSNTVEINLQTFDGATWNTVSTLDSGTSTNQTLSFTGNVDIDDTIEGIRIQFVLTAGTIGTSGTADLYTLEYGSMTASIIDMDIPAGTFSDDISSAIGVPFIEDWEDGADIEYKLTNGVDDSGWLAAGNEPIIQTFTAFASEPDQLLVRLTPKSTSPTIETPSIKGFWVRAE